MHRKNILYLLERYIESSAECAMKKQMVDFIRENIDCFERSLDAGHMTASCWLVNNDGSKALLMHHTKLDRWLQLGGHCDGDSDVLAVAVKEAQEESGIMGIELVFEDIFDIDVHLIPENSKNKAHYHYDVRFLLHVTSDEDIVSNRESKELRWIGKNKEELPTDNPSVVRMFNKWIALS